MAARTAAGSRATSWPATRTSPPSVCTSVDMICTVVVLPAPLGPNSENVVPAPTSRSMPSRTAVPPNDLRSPVAVIALVMLLLPPSPRPGRPRSRGAGTASAAGEPLAATRIIGLDRIVFAFSPRSGQVLGNVTGSLFSGRRDHRDGRVPWPGSHRDLAGQAEGLHARQARAEPSAGGYLCVSRSSPRPVAMSGPVNK
jgi:hypothetical protein